MLTIWVGIYECMCIHVCMYAHVCTYVHMYICMYKPNDVSALHPLSTHGHAFADMYTRTYA